MQEEQRGLRLEKECLMHAMSLGNANAKGLFCRQLVGVSVVRYRCKFCLIFNALSSRACWDWAELSQLHKDCKANSSSYIDKTVPKGITKDK